MLVNLLTNLPLLQNLFKLYAVSTKALEGRFRT